MGFKFRVLGLGFEELSFVLLFLGLCPRHVGLHSDFDCIWYVSPSHPCCIPTRLVHKSKRDSSGLAAMGAVRSVHGCGQGIEDVAQPSLRRASRELVMLVATRARFGIKYLNGMAKVIMTCCMQVVNAFASV